MNVKAPICVVCFFAATYLGMQMFGTTPGNDTARPRKTAARKPASDAPEAARPEAQVADLLVTGSKSTALPLPPTVSQPAASPPADGGQPPMHPAFEPLEVPAASPEASQLKRLPPKGRIRPPAIENPAIETTPQSAQPDEAAAEPKQSRRTGLFYDAVFTAKNERPSRVHIHNTKIGNVVILLAGRASPGYFEMRGAKDGHEWEVRGVGRDLTVIWDGKEVPPR